MANTSLKFGNGNWAIKEDSALAYSDQYDNFKPLPFDFSRTSSGTIVNKEGLIETVGNGIPRIDFSDSADGALLLEPQSTNLVTYSEDFSNSYWAKSSVTLTSGFLAPDGSNNAYKVEGTIGTSYLGNLTANTHLRSIYVRTVSGTGKVKLLGNTTLYDVTEEWTRVSFNPTSNTYQFAVDFRGGTDISEVLIWGVQVEQLSYPTSYIPTQGSTSTRIAETCTNSGSTQDFNSEEGVLYAEISALYDSGHRYISLNNSSITNRITIELYPNTETLVSRLTTNGVQKAFLVASNIVETNMNKIAIRYYLNNFSLWVNGNKIHEDLTDVPLPIGLDSLDFHQGSNSGYFYGKTKNIQVFNKALSDEELQKLTTI